MTPTAYINAGCVTMHHRQFRRIRIEFPLQFLALLPAQLTVLQTLKCGLLLFRMAYFLQIWICQARLGWRLLHNLSGGVELGPLQDPLATNRSIAATEV